MRFKCSNQCDMVPEQSECILALNNQGSCMDVSSVAIILHETQREIHFHKSLCGLYLIIKPWFLSLFRCLLKCQVTVVGNLIIPS